MVHKQRILQRTGTFIVYPHGLPTILRSSLPLLLFELVLGSSGAIILPDAGPLVGASAFYLTRVVGIMPISVSLFVSGPNLF